jgi:phosphinothricin acetyltransferase
MFVYIACPAELAIDIGRRQYRCMSKSLRLTPAGDASTCCVPLSQGSLSPEQAGRIAPLLKALGDPVRLRLISLVASRPGGEACVCELTDAFDLSQPTISHHLKVLHEEGLLDREKRGVWVYYRVRQEATANLAILLGYPAEAVTDEAVPDLAAARPEPRDPEGLLIRPMTAADADAVLTIYQAGLDSGNASFETVAPDWDTFDRVRLPQHRLVATATEGDVLGWVAATAVSDRCVYAGVIEHSVYVHPGARGRGVGSALLAALIGSAEAAGIWTIQSGIFPENTASLRLHQQAGFRVVGTRRRIGSHHGYWRDVILLERRSASS